MLVTKPKVIKLLEEAVNGNEDKIVSQCTYTVDRDKNSPNCLVGQVLYRLDPEILERLLSQQTSPFGECNGDEEAIEELVEKHSEVFGDIRFTNPAVEALTIAQQVQDGRHRDKDGTYNKSQTWGHALEAAREA